MGEERRYNRKVDRKLQSMANKAKIDMGRWLDTLKEDPTQKEMLAFKAGYIAGMNRANNNPE